MDVLNLRYGLNSHSYYMKTASISLFLFSVILLASCSRCKTCTVTVSTIYDGLDTLEKSIETEYCEEALETVENQTFTRTGDDGEQIISKYDCE